MKKIKTKSLILAAFIAIQTLIPSAFADFLNVRAYGTDTVAGYASLLKSSMLSPGKEIVFVVEKPDFSVVRVPAKADLEGVATADLYGLQTKMAGVYKVSVVYPATAQASPQNTFSVYPDQISGTQSDITSTSQMLEADGESKAFITVALYDNYRNPIKDHQVKLISSRPDDEITAINTGISGHDGKANFKLTSKTPGISVLSAIDLSANIVLSAREEVVFQTPVPKAIGGNFFSTQFLQADVINATGNQTSQNVLPGPVDHFEIQDLPSTVKVNTDQTLTVVARDKNGNIAKNYTGTILISTPDDENSVLPNNGEYTFKESDQGKFTFNLAIRFSKVGGQFIQVLDKNNWKITGEKEVEVTSGQAVTIPQNTASSLTIKSPTDGGQFGSNLIVITGQGDPNINIKIFDQDIKIGDSETDSDGFFSFQAQGLSPGNHTFYVMSDTGQVSRSVTVTIDTLPPALNFIQLSPDGVLKPGQAFSVRLSSEPDLEEVKIRFQGVEKDLFPQQGQPGNYSADFTAPMTPGSFPVDVLLVDSLSNKSQLQGQKTLMVVSDDPVAPPTVQNLQGAIGDSEVLLTWDPVTSPNGIGSYQVSYGTTFNNLNQVLQTQGNATSLKVTGLQNGMQYFFVVKAIDAKGLQSQNASVMIAVTPVSTDVTDTSGLQPAASEDGQFFGSGVVPVATLYNNPLTGTASGNAVTLTWQPFPGVAAAYYKVYFGLHAGQYDDYTIIPDNRTTVTITDLISNVPYFFAVVALNASGNEISPLSSELQIMPQGAGFQSLPASQITQPLSNAKFSQVPAQGESGAGFTWIVIFSLTFGAAIFYFNKRRIFN